MTALNAKGCTTKTGSIFFSSTATCGTTAGAGGFEFVAFTPKINGVVVVVVVVVVAVGAGAGVVLEPDEALLDANGLSQDAQTTAPFLLATKQTLHFTVSTTFMSQMLFP